MVRYLFYTIGDLTYQSPLVNVSVVGTTALAKEWDSGANVCHLCSFGNEK